MSFLSLLLLASPASQAEPPPQDLAALADKMVARVAQVRGIRPKRSVAKGVLGRQAILDKLMARIRKEYAPEEIADEERLLKRLGLLPKDANYEKAVMDLLLEQIAGFYDPFDRKLYIADWLDQNMQEMTLAHEITHALQDQRFGIRSYATPIKENGDRQLARAALVEGDGTLTMLEAMLPGVDLGAAGSAADSAMGGSGMPAYDRAPRFLRETLIFPYTQGLQFVRHIRRLHPWTVVDAVYDRPPESTEQVIHPEKYFARERPVDVKDVAIPALKDHKLVRRDVLGELVTRLYLEQAVAPDAARLAAEGWGGDRLASYSRAPTAEPLVVHLSTWDSDGDADEFARAANRVLAKSAGAPEAPLPAAYGVGGEDSFVERRGSVVLQLLGAPSERRTAIAEEIWRTWKVKGRPAGAGM